MISLLLGDSHDGTSSAGTLGVLASDLQAPEVAETGVAPDLLHPLHVFSHLGVVVVGNHLEGVAVLEVPLSVQEPLGHSVAEGVLHDVLQGLALFLRQLAGPQVRVHSGDLAAQVGEPPSDALDHSQTVAHLPLTVDVGVENTQDVLELGVVLQNEAHDILLINNIY